MLKINNVEWKIFYVPENDEHLRRYNTTMFSIGCCDGYEQAIYINKNLYGYLLKKVLCHELTHAAMFSYNIHLSFEQEEMMADFIATFGEEIVDITDLIYDNKK